MGDIAKKEIQIKFTKAADYRKFAATGVWGGPTPQGEIFCEFYVECQDLPELIKMEIDPFQGTQDELEKKTSGLFIREIQVGILMRPDIAKSVGEWLIRHADTMLKLKPDATH